MRPTLPMVLIIFLSHAIALADQKTPNFYAANSPQFTYQGRHYFDGQDVKYDFPCFRISFCYKASRIDWQVIDAWNAYQLSIDGTVVKQKFYPLNQSKITLFQAKMPEYHCIQLVKITENHYVRQKAKADSISKGVDVYQGELYQKETKGRLNFQFYGDSFTAAFGVDGSNHGVQCLSTSRNQSSCLKSWARRLSDMFEADFRMTASSGAGITQNGLKAKRPRLPSLASRVSSLSPQGSYVYQEKYAPDVIFVFAGLNDYLNLFHPSIDKFAQIYRQFLEDVMRRVITATGKQSKIINICGKDENDRLCQSVEKAVREFSYEYNQAYYIELPQGTILQQETNGCQKHPNEQGHWKIAKALYEPVKKIIQA